MNLKKIILIFFVTFLYFPFVRAVPDKVIFSGCVRDTLTKELLEFATIQLKGKNTFSVLSDKNGNFKFSSVLPGEYVLQFLIKLRQLRCLIWDMCRGRKRSN